MFTYETGGPFPKRKAAQHSLLMVGLLALVGEEPGERLYNAKIPVGPLSLWWPWRYTGALRLLKVPKATPNASWRHSPSFPQLP